MKTKILKVHPEFPELDAIGECAKTIRKGGLVVFPTETVYGIAADFTNPAAMKKLRQVKQRSDGKPFSVLIFERGLIANYTSSTDPNIYKLIDRFWPGPLTIVVPSKEDGTIGLRMPDHKIALKLVEASQCPIAAPSANIEDQPPPTTCEEALQDLDGLIDLAIDGGASSIGQGSTVLDLTNQSPKILRPGSITEQDVRDVTGKKNILFVCTGNSCRSVMADYLLKNLTKDRNDVQVASAGTSVFIHSRASQETMAVLQDEGINCSEHLSQPISTILLKKSDLIFVMTKRHRQQVLERVPSVEKRVYLLKEFCDESSGWSSDLDIPDPIGAPREAYRECLAVIKSGVKKVVELI